MNKNYFPEKSIPKVYCYTDTRFANCIKVGYTTKTAEERVAAQYPVKLPNMSYEIILEELAVRSNGTLFTDKDIHKLLNAKKVKHINGEWFECSLMDVKSCILEIKTGVINEDKRTLDFGLRPEQTDAIIKTEAYFNSFRKDPATSSGQKDPIPHFLWNAKMRFGKTFTTYQLAKKMGWKKILVLTFKPAVQSAWKEDLESHIDFSGWQFVSNKEDDLSFENIDTKKPFVFFGSFQDLLGKNAAGGIKSKNEWVHATNWDCVAFDEYHYGAWRENAKELFEAESKKEQEFAEGVGMEYFEEENMPITTNHYLYLSGTPFRAIGSGEFIEEQIFNWTYSDEQRAKIEWGFDSAQHPKGTPLNKTAKNPYLSLPRMVMLTYQMPDAIIEVAKGLLTPETIPTQFKVVPLSDDPTLVRSLSDQYRTLPGVEAVALAEDEFEVISTLSNFIRVVTLITSLVLLLVAVGLIWNTIRTAMFARRREIEVMKLVGATNWFIRIPFMLEGLLQGLIGGVVSCGGLWVLNSAWTSGVTSFKPGTGISSLVVPDSYLTSVMFILLAIGAVVGAVGSAIAATRFLDV